MITLYTISCDFKKHRTNFFVERRAANRSKCAIGTRYSRILDQFIGRNNEVILKELAEKLCKQGELTVSTSTI